MGGSAVQFRSVEATQTSHMDSAIMVAWQHMYSAEILALQTRQCASQARPMGFPRQTDLWKTPVAVSGAALDLLLQRSHWVCLHNRLCWLCLHLGLLAKHHPNTCLRAL